MLEQNRGNESSLKKNTKEGKIDGKSEAGGRTTRPAKGEGPAHPTASTGKTNETPETVVQSLIKRGEKKPGKKSNGGISIGAPPIARGGLREDRETVF